MTRIAVIVPVLGRPQNAQPLVDSLAASEADARIVFVYTDGDDEQRDACFATDCMTIGSNPNKRGDWAIKINGGFRVTTEEFILLGADDLRFHPGWDREALKVADNTGAGVIGTNDLGNPYVMRGQLATHALVRRSYIDEHGTIDEPGKVLHEGYQHNWVDLELTETARSRKQFQFARRSRVEHMHPNWGKAEMDATYDIALNYDRFVEDRNLLNSRRPLWSPRYARVLERQARQRQRPRRTR